MFHKSKPYNTLKNTGADPSPAQAPGAGKRNVEIDLPVSDIVNGFKKWKSGKQHKPHRSKLSADQTP